jgi:hypothetical protein
MIKKRTLSNARFYPNLEIGNSVSRFFIMEEGVVDGETLYTVQCNHTVARWLRENYEGKYYHHVGAPFTFYATTVDINEPILVAMTLRWV